MGRTKIDFGIDLGTTNSAIARMDEGKPVITKSDTNKDTVPSCVHRSKKGFLVGDTAANMLRRDVSKALKNNSDTANTFIEFKRLMGTSERYSSTNQEEPLSPEELSAEVLKKLKGFVNDEVLRSVVVTVPAKFTINQKDSTAHAAKLAGFDDCRLLQEPIAAAMAYGVDGKGKDGWWLVFDFGGGTFDAALLEVKDSIINVRDTEGDNLLGGKNLDLAVVDSIMIPYLKEHYSIQSYLDDSVKLERLRKALKYVAETAKIQLSFAESVNVMSEPEEYPADDNGTEIEIEMTVSREQLRTAIAPLYQKAIDITKQLLDRNNIGGSQIAAVIMVGGPTFSPIIREMLRNQISPNVDTSIDPMTAVARGAALFASTQDVSEQIKEESRDFGKIQLHLEYESNTVEMTELVTVKIDTAKTQREVPSPIFVEIVRADKQWSSGRIEFGSMGEVIDVSLEGGRSNAFEVVLYDGKGDVIPSEPGSIAILQGTRIGNATLPYHVGIGVHSMKKGYAVVKAVDGLEKNRSQPATGVAKGLRTATDIRPGVKEDILRIPVYEIEDGANNSRLINNQHVFDAVLTGEGFDVLLPAGSEVDVTMKIRDGQVEISAYFPSIDKTEVVEFKSIAREGVSAEWLEEELGRLSIEIDKLKGNDHAFGLDAVDTLDADCEELRNLIETGSENADTKMQALEGLRRLSQKVDDAAAEIEWPSKKEELEGLFYNLKELCDLDEVKSSPNVKMKEVQKRLDDYERQIAEIIRKKNVKLAEQLMEKMGSMHFTIRDAVLGVQMEIMMLNRFNDEFDSYPWLNRSKARQLVDQGIGMIRSNPTKERLRPVVQQLYKLLPDDAVGEATKGSGLLLG